MNNQPAESEWLATIVAQLTVRPCVVEFEPAHRSDFWLGGDTHTPARWRVTIKGVESTPFIQTARVHLRDEEHVKARIVSCLPESERPGFVADVAPSADKGVAS